MNQLTHVKCKKNVWFRDYAYGPRTITKLMSCFSRSAAVMHNAESQTIADMTFVVLPNSVWRSIVFSCLSTSVFVFSARIFLFRGRSQNYITVIYRQVKRQQHVQYKTLYVVAWL